ncbi:hypothetical protein [Phytobacter diazotrophicus]|uniref:hypothetical protein n=1 Tax=Phytobacter diazotrophicus TaxID=395631 RepID=UPI002935646E|nr:hypothetical protein [Phytobacter diazotrophicus]MDV2873880.1 hypothetical protein [Phytobacter diazotrophicus]
MSTSRTFQMKMVRPDEEEMAYLWKLFYAAQRVEDRWGHGLAEISEELSYCPDMTREQKLFLLRAWQVLAADKGGFGRFMGAYDTYVHNMQDPKDDCVAWKPSLIELFGNAELLPIVLEAYQEALQCIAELESSNKTVKLPPVSFFDFKTGSVFASGAYVNVEAMNKELAAAGITLDVGE